MRGDTENASRFAAEACAARPDRWVVHDRQAVLHFRSGRFADAAAGWRRVLELTPDNAKALAKLGSALLEQGELEQAEEAYRSSVEIEPTATALDGLGLVRFYEGAMEEAAHWFRRAVDAAPAQWRIWGNLADAQRHIPGQREESRVSLERAVLPLQRQLAENPSDALAWTFLALYLAKQELHAEALTALTRARALGSDSLEARRIEVLVLELAGRRGDALERIAALVATGNVPYELVAAPELADLRASPEGRDLFPPLPPASHVTVRLSPRRKTS